MLQSRNSTTRYDACEELRVTSSLPPEAIVALEAAAKDPSLIVADAAQRALAVHRPGAPQPRLATAPENRGSEAGRERVLRGRWLVIAGLALVVVGILLLTSPEAMWTTGIVCIAGGPMVLGVALVFWGLVDWFSYLR
jgi:Flp pilus assembly protein TadB